MPQLHIASEGKQSMVVYHHKQALCHAERLYFAWMMLLGQHSPIGTVPTGFQTYLRD